MDCARMFGLSLPTVAKACAAVPRSQAGIDDEEACQALAELTLASIGAGPNDRLWDQLLNEATAVLEAKRAVLAGREAAHGH